MAALTLHASSCLWYTAACPLSNCSTSNSTWIVDVPWRGDSELYCTSLYWTLATMTSTGYGDIHSHNIVEMWISSMVMMAGKLVFGLVLANIASTLAHSEATRVQYDSKLQAIRGYMVDQSVPKKLQKRVIEYFKYLWSRWEGKSIKKLLIDAPSCLQSEIFLTITRDMLDSIPLFEDFDEAFFRYLCCKVELVSFLSGDHITLKGNAGTTCYYIQRGEVEIVGMENKLDGDVLGPGDVIGEMSLVCTGVPRHFTATALTVCDAFTLSKESLDEALEHFPKEKLLLRERAKLRVKHSSTMESPMFHGNQSSDSDVGGFFSNF